ncbi:class I SAM-dependent methyltransferase [Limisalsivibrio acetivorans]|uniref:class I SAM-dependent methyltransferase n=1 Tax=Limisalsivibrio acetivorans TaxID=1304888 RepID=UPI0003B5A732|nr:class I SAM-dependent methyltransferase [Limisalsivibrio acetivorans]
MAGGKKIDTREAGLELGIIMGRYFLGSDHLHYGFWSGLEVNKENLKEAQEAYTDNLVSAIPEGVVSVLDVGCGIGKNSRRLKDEGYSVEGVSPSDVLSEYARELMGDDYVIYPSLFEEAEIDKTYDLILFSESFQYMDLERVFDKALGLLNPGGCILICDFFKKDVPGKCVIGGGHRMGKFYKKLAEKPLDIVRDDDITAETAPTMDLVNELMEEVGKPFWNLIFIYMEQKSSILSKFVKWKFKKKINKIEHKYLKGLRNSEHFSEYKSYRLILIRNARK